MAAAFAAFDSQVVLDMEVEVYMEVQVAATVVAATVVAATVVAATVMAATVVVVHVEATVLRDPNCVNRALPGCSCPTHPWHPIPSRHPMQGPHLFALHVPVSWD